MDITRDQFEALLAWLGPNPESAGQKYKTIHTGLTRMFITRGFSDAEDLADQTIRRVVTLLPEVKDAEYPDRAPYFYKVARYIMLEAQRRPEIATDVFPVVRGREDNPGDRYEFLLRCLDLLPEEKRELILEYYLYQGREKIEQHKRMAEERRITVGALRSRAHHIRDTLEGCVRGLLKSRGRNERRHNKHC